MASKATVVMSGSNDNRAGSSASVTLPSYATGTWISCGVFPTGGFDIGRLSVNVGDPTVQIGAANSGLTDFALGFAPYDDPNNPVAVGQDLVASAGDFAVITDTLQSCTLTPATAPNNSAIKCKLGLGGSIGLVGVYVKGVANVKVVSQLSVSVE